ncbi:MAG: transcriptional regulator [Terracidiphilus sp.]
MRSGQHTIGFPRKNHGFLSFFILAFFAVSPGLHAQEAWSSVGPDGGDARYIASVPGQPGHLYLGTVNSWIYDSSDAGASWHRLSRLGTSDDLVVDHILVDPESPAHIYAAAWKIDHPDGGLWISHDGGRTWDEAPGLHGQSIRSFAMAPQDPHLLFAGTLQGVFRSADAGATWTQISPEGSREIHEVESLAIDPTSPDTIYAGTWHLPWKTTDGGKTWHNIKKGVIDDSDVFSIIIDPAKPTTVYASACSGIYKSNSAGELFRKIQGIPATARRTRVLRQDSQHPLTVYAGTTEGLYKTTDGGHTFSRMTNDDVIVNDVYIDPANSDHILLATDRGGVLASADGAKTFTASNRGFSERKVEALLVDANDPHRLYAGVLNDKAYGGAFVSTNGGATWQQIADGLEGRDVFVLAQAPDGTLLAGTNSGIFALAPDATAWQPRDTIANTIVKTDTEKVRGTRVNIEKRVKAQPYPMDGRVFAIDLSGDAWLATAAGGIYTSHDQGVTWQGGPVLGVAGYLSLTVHGALIAAARPDGVVLSKDNGQTWWPMSIPTVLTRIHRVVFSRDGTLWLGAREGVYFTRNNGKTWMWAQRLPIVDIDDLFYDAATNRVLVSSRGSDFVYAMDPATLDWKWWQTGYKLSAVRSAGDRLLAASLYNGVLIEPRAAATELGRK